MVSFPYYSYIFRDSCGSGMGILWVMGSHYWGSLKILLISTFTIRSNHSCTVGKYTSPMNPMGTVFSKKPHRR